MENENISFTEFEEAFDGSADYQTDGNEDAATEEDIVLSDEPETVSEEGQTGGETAQDDAQEQPADGSESKEDQPAQQEETFILKVNKEEKTCSREEVITLAQKGADYDRVKEQLEKSRQENTELQSKLTAQQDAMSVLEELAKDSGTDLTGLMKSLRIGLLKKQGLSEDAANERLLRLAAEKENASLKAAAAEAKTEPTGADRAQREIAEFRESYPDTELSKELLDKLMGDVQGGMTLTQAYRKYESAQKDAQIAELQRQLAAEKQNKENLASSPGSQSDSGGKRTKSDYDDFLEAFE